MSQNRYINGDYNVICDHSGFKAKRSECKRTWDGQIVLKRFYYERHPQDFVKGILDDQSVPESRSEGVDNFITSQITPEDL